MTKGHPLKGCLFYFPNFVGYCPRSRYLANGKKSEGELAHSCEGRCSPSDSPLSATLKNKKAEFAGEEMDNRDIIWWILFRNGCDVVERQFISRVGE